jgi:hypothetical protein
LSFAFSRDGENAALPFPLIELTVATLTGFLRLTKFTPSITQDSQMSLLREVVNALLDSRLNAAAVALRGVDGKKQADALVKAINKVCYQ